MRAARDAAAYAMSNPIKLIGAAATRQRCIAPRGAFSLRLPITGPKIAPGKFNIDAAKTTHASRIDILTNPSVRPAFAARRHDRQGAANASRSRLRARLPRAAISNG
jgi:hypothetical protein